jgi:hypothetical protein
VFDEASKWRWENDYTELAVDNDPLTIEYSTELVYAPTPATTMPSPSPVPVAPPVGEDEALVVADTEFDDKGLDADHDDAPLRLCSIKDIVKDAPVPGLACCILTLSSSSPRLMNQHYLRRQNKSWRSAMSEEIHVIQDNGTWELATLPTGHQAIGLKWVHKVKHNEASNIVRHKARLVAKSYVQHAGIDFDEVFAPVARLESVRMLVALVAHERWQVHHMDVKSAFLNDMIKEEVYLQQALDFIIIGQEEKVLRLHKVLYGLCQASRA